MRLRWVDSLGGRFAARLFVRFLLAAALPIAAVAVLASVYTSEVISEQAYERLRRDASNYGNTLYGRLLLAQDQLVTLEDAGELEARGEQRLPTASKAFTAVARVLPGGEQRVLIGEDFTLPETPADRAKQATASQPALALTRFDGERRVVMLRPAEHGDGWLIGILKTEYLFGVQGDWPFATQFCVLPLGEDGALFCPELGIEDAKVARAMGPLEDDQIAKFPLDGETLWAIHRDLFLPSGFTAPTWRVVVLQPESQALAAASVFTKLFPPAALLAVLSASLFGLTQIRRMNRPLQKLRLGVRDLASGQFDARVAVDSADEFEELGHAFNGMAERLGRQFHALETLSEVDRRILQSEGVGAIVNTVLKGVDRVVTGDLVAVLVRDFDIVTRGRLFMVDTRQPAEIHKTRVKLEPEVFRSPGREQAVQEFDLSSPGFPAYLEGLAAAGASHAFGVAAEEGNHLWAFLVIGYRQPGPVPEQDRAAARTVGDRLAVALAAASRTQQLIHQAHYDLLTQLPNRQLLMDRLRQEIAHSERQGYRFALLFIDLDRFKNVNDAVGHSIGDRLLVEAASRLRGCVREADTVARWGGDEFVAVIPAVDKPSEARDTAQRIIEALGRPYQLHGREHHVGASIGIALYPGDGANAEQLLKNADAALYRAKERGRGRSVFFENSMNEAIRYRTELEADLRRAVADEAFTLAYQPQVQLADGRIEAVEALLRWRREDGSMVSPADFVPVLEDIGAIEVVGEWVLRQACAQLASGFDTERPIQRVAVNVSARQFLAGDLVGLVERTLLQSGLPARALEVEITETVLLSNLDQACRVAGELRELGVRVAMDDFGTGYSSLSYLRRLPIDTLKIDRMFLGEIESNGQALAIVESIISMAHALGRSVVAEGVESAGQARLLAERGCELGQGFYFARPLPADELRDAVVTR